MAKLLALVAFAWIGVATGQSSPPGAESAVTRFVEAWNEHDSARFAALFAADADWVTASGARLRGREAIHGYLASEHAGWAKHTRMRPTNVHVRSLGTATASVFFEWEIAEVTADAKSPMAARRGNNLFVVAKEGDGWIIVAGQVARR